MAGKSGKVNWKTALALFAGSVILFIGYMHVYTFVFSLELPKTRVLKRENAVLRTKARVLSSRMQQYSNRLVSLEIRDNDIYRSIFGLKPVPSSVRESGIPAKDLYMRLDASDRSGKLGNLRKESDRLCKKAFIQSRSFDDVELLLHHADDMSSSIPAICPVSPDWKRNRISSSFGYRYHPILHYRVFHKGMDFSVKKGEPVYATGDGVVSSIRMQMYGYGRQLVIDHGFGYKTRYAHLHKILVTEGMKVKRGEIIATAGNTGLSSGPHLHYEVIFQGRNRNPYHYFDRDIPIDQFEDMVRLAENSSEKMYVHPMHRKKKKK